MEVNDSIPPAAGDPGSTAVATPPSGPRRLGATASGLLSLLLVGSVFAVPLVGLVLAPMAPIPVLHFQARGGRGALAWGPVVAALATAALLGFADVAGPVLAAYLLVVVLPVASVAWWRRAGWSEGRWAAVTTAVGTVALLAAIAALAAPESPVAATATWIRAAVAEAEELSAAMGLGRGEMELALDAVERSVAWVVPAFPVAYLVAILFWLRPRLQVLGYQVPTGLFDAYASDEWLPAGFAALGAATLVLTGTARWVALNLLLAVLILYFVHGLAIIRAHLARWVGRGWLVRWGIALICLQMPFPPLVVILGVADSFRPLRPRQNDDGGTP